MALDPSLVTSVLGNWQTPQFQLPDPIAQFAKIQALKSGIIQQQTQQLQLQQQQQQIAGQQALSDAIRNNMTTDPTTGAPVINHAGVTQALGGGGFGYLIPKYQEGVTAQQKADADKQQVLLKNQEAMLDQATREFANATDQTSWDNAIAHAHGLGADTAKMGIPAVYSPEAKDQVANLALNAKDRIAAQNATLEAQTKQKAETREQQTQKDKEADAALQALAGANADTFGELRADAMAKLTAAGRSPGMVPGAFSKEGQAALNEAILTADQRRQATAQAATEAETKRHNLQSEADSSKRLGVEYANLAIRKEELARKYNSDYANLSEGDQKIAEKVARGEMSVQQLSRMPNKQGITAAAIELNPNWSAATFDTRQAFTDPNKKQAQNLGTISRIVGHIGQFEKNSGQMGFDPVYGSGAKVTGLQKALGEDSHAISAELEKLLSGGVGSVSQIKAWQDSLDSPFAGVRQKAIDEISQLIGSQYEGMNQTYKAGLGEDLPVGRYVTPAGQEWMRKKGINVAVPAAAGAPGAPAGAGGGKITVIGGDGSVHPFNSEAEARAFETLVKQAGGTTRRQ